MNPQVEQPYIEPRNWCGRCGVYATETSLCPVGRDDDRRRTQAVSQMASMCRG